MTLIIIFKSIKIRLKGIFSSCSGFWGNFLLIPERECRVQTSSRRGEDVLSPLLKALASRERGIPRRSRSDSSSVWFWKSGPVLVVLKGKVWFSPSVLVLPADPGRPAGSKHLVNARRTSKGPGSASASLTVTPEELVFQAEPGPVNQNQANVCSTC